MTRAYILLFCLFALVLPVSSQSRVFSISLTDYGWRPTSREPVRERELVHFNQTSFDLLRTLYVGFTLKKEGGLQERGQSAMIFRVLAIDIEKGSVMHTLDFETHSPYRAGLMTSGTGALRVVADEQVQSIDTNGKVISSFRIPKELNYWDTRADQIWKMRESASGNTLYVSGHRRYFLDTDTLKELASCADLAPKDEPQTFNDGTQMTTDGDSPNHELVGGPLCGHSRHLRWLGTQFYDPVLLQGPRLLEINRRQLRCFTGGDEPVWSLEFPPHLFAEGGWEVNVKGAKNGERFAVELTEERGGRDVLDLDPRLVATFIAVYDARSGRQVGMVKMAKLGVDDFALTADGEMLVIRHDQTVEVWKL